MIRFNGNNIFKMRYPAMMEIARKGIAHFNWQKMEILNIWMMIFPFVLFKCVVYFL